MRILIQNKENHFFWKNELAWTLDAHDAHDFETTTAAEKLCCERQLSQVQIVLKFKRIPEVILPIR
jgi:hypothetical protein